MYFSGKKGPFDGRKLQKKNKRKKGETVEPSTVDRMGLLCSSSSFLVFVSTGYRHFGRTPEVPIHLLE
jgi:hypothetical protein